MTFDLLGARRKKRQTKLDRPASADVSQAMLSSGDAAASDGDTLSNGDTPVKSGKSRTRLWDSFLSKTRKIRIRKSKAPAAESSKLQARASSQPNIPISADESFRSRPMSASSPDETNKTFPSGPSKDRWRDYGIVDDEDDIDNKAYRRRREDDGNDEDDEDDESNALNRPGSSSNLRRAVYRRAPEMNENSRTRSSSSNDDIYDSTHERSVTDQTPVTRKRVGRRFFHRQTPDDGYRSSQDHSNNNSGNVDKVSRLPPSGNRRARANDLNNDLSSTPKKGNPAHEPRSLSREDLDRADSPAGSEDVVRENHRASEAVPEDDRRESMGVEEAEPEEDGVPVVEQSDLQNLGDRQCHLFQSRAATWPPSLVIL
ncbi:hypothetical protein EGW08_014524 [Elysia chlorotica]|uniref:Uncharacterized protein n=1 Tax=Elysia chlorotica TaxID=188477 RepID=A0A3S1B8N4_ELYCH|nr:hypothetical protein EGW08_014524 [Elysia chlorotica]